MKLPGCMGQVEMRERKFLLLQSTSGKQVLVAVVKVKGKRRWFGRVEMVVVASPSFFCLFLWHCMNMCVVHVWEGGRFSSDLV